MGKKPDKRRSRGRRSNDQVKSELPIYAAYVILIIRLLALVSVHVAPEPGPSAQVDSAHEAQPAVTADASPDPRVIER